MCARFNVRNRHGLSCILPVIFYTRFQKKRSFKLNLKRLNYPYLPYIKIKFNFNNAHVKKWPLREEFFLRLPLKVFPKFCEDLAASRQMHD